MHAPAQLKACGEISEPEPFVLHGVRRLAGVGVELRHRVEHRLKILLGVYEAGAGLRNNLRGPRVEHREVGGDLRCLELRRLAKLGFMNGRKVRRRREQRLHRAVQPEEIVRERIARGVAERVHLIQIQHRNAHEERLAEIKLQPARGEAEAVVRIGQQDRSVEAQAVGQRQPR